MKFSTLLKSNKLQGWEQFYLQYSKLLNYLKKDKHKFKSLLQSEFTKITDFFNDIENQTDEQRKILFKIISVTLTDNKLEEKHFKNKLKHRQLREKMDKIKEEEDKLNKLRELSLQSKTNTSNSIVNLNEDLSVGGEESDYENIHIIEKTKSKEQKERKKQKFLNFDSFIINAPFEKRKKEKAFHELLQAINSVKSFRDINYMGLKNIIRKYMFKNGSDEFSSDFLKKLHQSHFGKSKKIEKMQKDVRFVYKKVFVLDDNLQAQNIFKRIGKKDKPHPFITFFIGVSLTILLFLICITDLNQNQKVKIIASNIALLQLGGFLFGLCELLFVKFNINYNHIFNFDVISNLSPVNFLLFLSITLNITFLACFLFIEKIPNILIYGLIFLPISIIILPFDILWYKSRLYFISVFIGTFFSGFRKVYFKNFFFADVFQSFTPCLKTLCFELGLPKTYFSVIFLNNIWPSVRILQCFNRYMETKSSFPHLLNMSKYCLVFLAGIFNALYNLDNNELNHRWKIFFCFSSSSFSLLWDFFLDWTIFRTKKIYPLYYYKIGSLFNLISRYAWILLEMKYIENEFLLTVIEIIRRFVWALFRVENEHVNNCTNDRSKMGFLFSKELFFIKDSNTYKTPNDNIQTIETLAEEV
ncbi:xenotropic and polytropic retrovirus receptor 1-like protein [Vairimorpha necatrix]|uniref:Xenotropic and polytropic retrovirus receptor 1-like protein n=1 Tax=Vairimorpha necatrix TaxID=6039 RepID=A0AAX4JD63_9MICR